MTTPEPDWESVKRLVAEALDLPAGARRAHIERASTDPGLRRAATRLLRACEQAAHSPVLDASAAELASGLIHEVDQQAAIEALDNALEGRYRIEREVGRGGMATVYLARDLRHGRDVAIKLLRPSTGPGDSPARSAARFQREIRIAAGLSHPHILPLYDSGAADGLLFYITPFVDGESLRERLKRTGPPPVTEAVQLLRDVARALAHAHRQDLVHRDIKPANILVTRDGDALVADFGVARALAAVQADAEMQDGTVWMPGGSADETLVVGTPAYMAPEQVAGAPDIDRRADLYALGALAYELLTGWSPFAGRPRHEQLAAHAGEVPEPVASRCPEAPPELAGLVDRLLSKRPDDRPDGAEAVLEVLERVISEQASEAPARRGTPDPEAYRLYMKGRHLLGTRQRDALFSALKYFERAIARDSGFARAFAGVADTWVFLSVFGHVRPHDGFRKARTAAERALELDGGQVEGHAALAHIQFLYDWDWGTAESALKQAIAMDPSYPELRMYYASLLHCVRRSEEALTQLDLARELDPVGRTGIYRGRILVDTNHPDEAIEVLQEEVALEPRRDLAHQCLAHAFLQRGRDEEAVASMQRAAALSGPRDTAQLAYIHARTGDVAEARRVLAGLFEGGSPPDILGFHLAMAYSGLGDADEAFRWLEAAYRERAGFMSLLRVSSGFEAIRADPRLGDLLARMGLR
jgi:serine/threonine protein kinase/Flp pilus assembly protein TadD